MGNAGIPCSCWIAGTMTQRQAGWSYWARFIADRLKLTVDLHECLVLCGFMLPECSTLHSGRKAAFATKFSRRARHWLPLITRRSSIPSWRCAASPTRWRTPSTAARLPTSFHFLHMFLRVYPLPSTFPCQGEDNMTKALATLATVKMSKHARLCISILCIFCRSQALCTLIACRLLLDWYGVRSTPHTCKLFWFHSVYGKRPSQEPRSWMSILHGCRNLRLQLTAQVLLGFCSRFAGIFGERKPSISLDC